LARSRESPTSWYDSPPPDSFSKTEHQRYSAYSSSLMTLLKRAPLASPPRRTPSLKSNSTTGRDVPWVRPSSPTTRLSKLSAPKSSMTVFSPKVRFMFFLSFSFQFDSSFLYAGQPMSIKFYEQIPKGPRRATSTSTSTSTQPRTGGALINRVEKPSLAQRISTTTVQPDVSNARKTPNTPNSRPKPTQPCVSVFPSWSYYFLT